MELRVKLRRLDPERKHEWLDFHNNISERVRAAREVFIPKTEEQLEEIRRENKALIQATSRDYEKAASVFSDSKVMFAEVCGKPVGMMVCTLVPGWDIAELEELNVNPAFRGKGIGFQLLENLINEARMYGCKIITVTPSGDSAEFYRRLGFKGNYPENPTEMWLNLNDYWTSDSDFSIH